MGALVFVLIGQSNLIRTGATTTRDTNPADAHLAGTLRWFLTHNPDGTVTVPQGPGLGLGRGVVQGSGRDVMLVGGATGGATIAMWQRGQPLYDQTVGVTASVRDDGGTLAAVVVSQGETDARSDCDPSLGALHPDDWHVYLAALCCALRVDLGLPDLPVLLSPLATTTLAVHGNWERVRTSQDAVCVPGLVVVDPRLADPPVELHADGLHWTESSFGDHGRRLASAYLALGC